ncbi:MAG TPA: RluA family pseudouridine synthase [Longimicrobiaceae bacterium]|nr:RluA family pseudouridine synthase [Longimicrobiaceae bacterium]
MNREERLVQLKVEEDSPARLDVYLSDRLSMSRSRVAQLFDAGEITVNGKLPRKRDRPSCGDSIEVRLPAPEPSPLTPEPLPLDIVYQDDDLLVVNKAAGMVVHPAPGHRSGTLVNALLHAVDDLSGIGGVLRPGIVHRLDKDTSGLLIVAKHDEAHRRLADALRKREIRRRYLTLCWGGLPDQTVTVEAAIGRDPRHRKRMAVVEEGRRALTRFHRLERLRAADLLSAELGTGRTHQIRVHLHSLGHPVVGDDTYGTGWQRGFSGPERGWARELAQRVPRQFLHSADLRFTHPVTGGELHFTVPLPADLHDALDWARRTSAARS